MHVLDEVMENVNMWVKSLPLNDDKQSWLLHSANVSVARRCMLFEKFEYKRGIIDFERLVDEGIMTERKYDHNKYVSSSKTTEKQRIFECLTSYFGQETEGRESNLQSLLTCSKNLTTPLNMSPTLDNNHNSLIDNDLELIFDNINSIQESNP